MPAYLAARLDCAQALGLVDIAQAVDHWKAAGLDLTPILHQASRSGEFGQFEHQDLRCTHGQDHGLDKALDNELIRRCQDALLRRKPVEFSIPIRNARGPPAATAQLSTRHTAAMDTGHPR